MFETLELPYKLPKDIVKKYMLNRVSPNWRKLKFDFAHDVFTFLNERSTARERQMTETPIRFSLLHTKPQFRGVAPKQNTPRARRTGSSTTSKPPVIPPPPKVPPVPYQLPHVLTKHVPTSKKCQTFTRS